MRFPRPHVPSTAGGRAAPAPILGRAALSSRPYSCAAGAAAVAVALAVVALTSASGALGASGKAAEFFARNPHGNVSCAMYDGYAGSTEAMCESAGRGGEARSALSAGGRVTVCIARVSSHNACNLGNAGDLTPTYGYGRKVSVGRFRCQVLRRGVRCTVASSGKGFLFNPGKTTAVGGASLRRVKTIKLALPFQG